MCIESYVESNSTLGQEEEKHNEKLGNRAWEAGSQLLIGEGTLESEVTFQGPQEPIGSNSLSGRDIETYLRYCLIF